MNLNLFAGPTLLRACRAAACTLVVLAIGCGGADDESSLTIVDKDAATADSAVFGSPFEAGPSDGAFVSDTGSPSDTEVSITEEDTGAMTPEMPKGDGGGEMPKGDGGGGDKPKGDGGGG